MTQKNRAGSFMSRQNMKSDRERQRAMNSIYKDMDELYLECVALKTSPSNALILLKDPTRLRTVTNPQALLAAAKVLERDMKTFNDSLNDIKAKADKVMRKQVVTEMDLVELLPITELYQDWITSYQLVVVPAAFEVVRCFPGAEEELNRLARARGHDLPPGAVLEQSQVPMGSVVDELPYIAQLNQQNKGGI